MIIIIGKTASGKDTILNELIKHGYHKMVVYTSRPMRTGEVQGKTYHFISEDKFLDMIRKGLFLEYKSYKTIDGTWYYGSLIEDYENSDNNTVAIMNPYGYKELLEKTNIPHKAIYIYTNNPTIKERLAKRGDKKEEADRRLKQDNKDFKGIENMVDKIIYNNSNDKIENIVSKILTYLRHK